MKGLLALACLLAGPTMALPVSAQDSDAYARAVEARVQGRPEEAARLLRDWLATRPDDVDARLQLAYADLALGNLDAAEAGFRAVIAAAPEYRDAQDGLAMVAERRRAGDSVRRAELGIEGAFGITDGPVQDWRELRARVILPAGETATIEGAVTHYRRFGLTDLELLAGLTSRVADELWLRAEASATPSADFRPEWGVGAGFDWRLRDGATATVLTADMRHQQFPTQDVTTISPGLVQYFAGGSGWVTLRAPMAVPQGEALKVGWSVRADIVPSERARVFGGFARGPDTDLGVVTTVKSLYGGGQVPLTDDIALTLFAAREWRAGGVDRTDIRLGFRLAL